MFSTTYSESAYPSNCGMYELKCGYPVSLGITTDWSENSPLQPLDAVNLNGVVIG